MYIIYLLSVTPILMHVQSCLTSQKKMIVFLLVKFSYNLHILSNKLLKKSWRYTEILGMYIYFPGWNKSIVKIFNFNFELWHLPNKLFITVHIFKLSYIHPIFADPYILPSNINAVLMTHFRSGFYTKKIVYEKFRSSCSQRLNKPRTYLSHVNAIF